LGLKYGGVPSINSLNSIYNFQVRVALAELLMTHHFVTFLFCVPKLFLDILMNVMDNKQALLVT